ncbi:MAG TPA: Lrp/AsnC ligand binding domain-containing protein [Chloroflexota bacterium]|nr:Lrp/AsnC ligand binding domain-containing protein [Chloroflexota bacterium]
MRLQDVLAAVPGLEKRFVHYLEGQGYIRPTKLQKARIARRDYSEADVERIRAIWRYYQRGISIQRAWELVARPGADGAYVFFPVPAGRWGDAVQLLRGHDNVIEASAVYGETADVVAHLRAPHESDVYGVLDALFEASIISGLPQVLRHASEAMWHSGQDEAGEDEVVRAWVLIKVPAKQLDGLVEQLRRFPGIVEASAIYGETDVIAKIEVPDSAALDELVVHKIQGIEVVESTRTFIGIGGLHWTRN